MVFSVFILRSNASCAPVNAPAATADQTAEKSAEASLSEVSVRESVHPEKEGIKDKKVTFNFVDVDLSAITKFISEITGKNFIFDEKVKGKITIIAPSKLSVQDAYSLFTSVLELKGFTIVPSGVAVYKIVPAIEAKQRGMQISTGRVPVNESYTARLIPIKYISSDDALRFLQPIVSKDGHISAFGPGNLLLVIDSGLNLEKVRSILEVIDQPLLREEPEIVLLKYASAEVIARILNEGISYGKSRPGSGQVAKSEEVKVVPDQRLNAVVIFGDKLVRESIKGLVALLDIPAPGAQGRINVCFLENADATELSKVLEGMLKGTPVKQTATAAAGSQAVTPFEAGGGIVITPDKATNSLVIVASPADYQNLIQVVKQLDRRRKQVYVEGMIVEASIDKVQDLGLKWRITAQKGGAPVAIGGFGTIDSSSVQGILSGLSGMTVGGMGNFINVPFTTVGSDGTVTNSTLTVPGFSALFSMQEFKDAINVLSTPQILTSDNKEAEIIVGENVPLISKQEANAAQPQALFTDIERKDVGVILKLTPQITEGDYVKLDLYQEITAVEQGQANIIATVGPNLSKRSTRTSVVVKDNQTVIIGGLIQERVEETVTKIPFLGDIPGLGLLFKNKSKEKTKTNLLVFLTPHIVKEAEQLAKLTDRKKVEFARTEDTYIQGELLVKFREGITGERMTEILSGEGATVISLSKLQGLYHISLKKGQDVEDAVKIFNAYKEVEYAEPNYMMKIK